MGNLNFAGYCKKTSPVNHVHFDHCFCFQGSLKLLGSILDPQFESEQQIFTSVNKLSSIYKKRPETKFTAHCVCVASSHPLKPSALSLYGRGGSGGGWGGCGEIRWLIHVELQEKRRSWCHSGFESAHQREDRHAADMHLHLQRTHTALHQGQDIILHVY